MKYITIIILFSITFSSCQKRQKLYEPKSSEKIVSISQLHTDYDTLIKKVKYNGDVDAYDELFYVLMDSNETDRTDTLMYYSKIMAEKYNNEVAYFYYLTALCEKYNIPFRDGDYSTINISLMDDTSKKLAENWLTKMLEKKVITQDQYNSVKR
jgi:hypothetical protein